MHRERWGNCHTFVGGVSGSTTNDIRSTRGLFNAQSVFTDILPPHILNRARTKAVNTLSLSRSDNDVLESGSARKDKDSIVVTTLALIATIWRRIPLVKTHPLVF